MAHKFTNDARFSMAKMGRVGGVSPEEMRDLELCFLEKLDWNLAVSEAEFD